MRTWMLSLLALVLLLPGTTSACPSCRDAIPQTSGTEEVDQFREAQGYNQSIYLMLAVPYLALGVVGFCVYRGMRPPENGPDAS